MGPKKKMAGFKVHVVYPVPGAEKPLTSLRPEYLADLVWVRACRNSDPRLPELDGEEYPAEVFIDLVEQKTISHPDFVPNLRAACASLLRDEGRKELTDARVTALGEVCSVVARSGAVESIGPLARLAERSDVGVEIENDEDLRQRSSICLPTLLADYPNHPRSEYRALFEHALRLPGCEMLALTALIGLWPKVPRNEFIQKLPKRYHLDLAALETELAFASFDSTRNASRPNGG